ncbi:Dabb family protein [Omnitrophica bacterium]|nr:Dabb family protein [Candidatus Omnitrophota bacterium]
MLTHSVYFWLKKELTPDQIKSFEKGLRTISEIDVVKKIEIGKPAPTVRPAVDRTYDYGIVISLSDMDAHQKYQDHPLHKSFLENHRSKWNKVVIYDVLND